MSRRLDYDLLQARLAEAVNDHAQLGAGFSDAWAADYRAHTAATTELVEIDVGKLTYLFDVAQQRLVGVYGTSTATQAARPSGRIRGHPLPSRAKGGHVDRGHVVAHSIGGGADINLVPQLHSLNISREWRAFERHLQTNPGTFFSVHLEYDDDTQVPARFVYALLRDGRLEHETFANS